jgi:peptide deformylase
MQLVKSNDPILITQCQPFNFQNPQTDPFELAKDMVQFMYDNNGLGLACNQIGLPYSMFVMRGHPENFACFNPRIVSESAEVELMEESCLSFPGLVVKVKRPKSIRARFMMANGETKTEPFVGMSARVFQHEMDHLSGQLFYNKANKFHKEAAMKKWKRGDMSSIYVKPSIGEYGEYISG